MPEVLRECIAKQTPVLDLKAQARVLPTHSIAVVNHTYSAESECRLGVDANCSYLYAESESIAHSFRRKAGGEGLVPRMLLPFSRPRTANPQFQYLVVPFFRRGEAFSYPGLITAAAQSHGSSSPTRPYPGAGVGQRMPFWIAFR
jgi:hypothetical protein